MPSNPQTPERASPRDLENAQRRWSEELERDRLAATIMDDARLPYPGPGAVAGSAGALGMARDSIVGDEDGISGKAKGVAVDAALAYATGPKGWIDFVLKHKEVVAVVLGLAVLLTIMQWLPLLVFIVCLNDRACAAQIGIGIAKAIWSQVMTFLFGS